jgi:hypothetical protein
MVTVTRKCSFDTRDWPQLISPCLKLKKPFGVLLHSYSKSVALPVYVQLFKHAVQHKTSSSKSICATSKIINMHLQNLNSRNNFSTKLISLKSSPKLII